MYRNYRGLSLLCLFLVFAATLQAQIVSGRQLLAEMKKASAKMRAASYVVEYSNIISNDRKDSSISCVITVQARKLVQQPGDYYFYVQRNGGALQTEASYCGSVLIERKHFSLVAREDTARYRVSKGGRLPLDPDTLSSAQGFIRDVLYGRGFQTGFARAEALKLFDGQRNWILEWEETNPKTTETSVWQLQVDKSTLLPVEVKMRSYRGALTTRRKILFRNMQLNENANEVSCL